MNIKFEALVEQMARCLCEAYGQDPNGPDLSNTPIYPEMDETFFKAGAYDDEFDKGPDHSKYPPDDFYKGNEICYQWRQHIFPAKRLLKLFETMAEAK